MIRQSLVVGDFTFNPSQHFLKKLCDRHDIADLAELKERLTGVMISAMAGRLRKKIPHRQALRTTQSMRRALNRFRELADEDISLTVNLLRDQNAAPGELKNLISDYTQLTEKLAERLNQAEARLLSNQFVSATINLSPGRPKSAKYEWLWELWEVFCDLSPQRTIVNGGSDPKHPYSGDFYNFARVVCDAAKLPIGDDDLAQSLKRVIKKNISQKSG